MLAVATIFFVILLVLYFSNNYETIIIINQHYFLNQLKKILQLPEHRQRFIILTDTNGMLLVTMGTSICYSNNLSLSLSLSLSHNLSFKGVGFIGRNLVQFLIDHSLTSKIRVVDKVPPATGWLNEGHKVPFAYQISPK